MVVLISLKFHATNVTTNILRVSVFLSFSFSMPVKLFVFPPLFRTLSKLIN